MQTRIGAYVLTSGIPYLASIFCSVLHSFLGKARSNPPSPSLHTRLSIASWSMPHVRLNGCYYRIFRSLMLVPLSYSAITIQSFIQQTILCFTKKMKHIEIDCHIVREKQAKVIHLLPISSQDQLADFYTKPLALGPFHRLGIKLGMIDIHAPA